ncbi:MAG: homoserine dehydrogenase [Campylobacteraceae bacterium]|nr:homoserine dehydrogenase [Campylobacteraceae bacterium]
MKIAILGVGVVGSSVAKILQKNAQSIKARSGKEIVPVVGLVKDISKKRDIDLPLSDDLQSILDRDDIDVFVELLGGIDTPYEIAKQVLKKGKSLVTANKAMLAYHRDELQHLASDVNIGFEASVAGGIPIIKALREGLSANKIISICGIMNGTCNYILTKMMDENIEFEQVLKEAQELGYAEADPTFDVGGFDAAHKLLILSSIAYGIHAAPEDILIEGIKNISQDDIAFAKEFDYKIKLLCIAKKSNNHIELRVHPALIPRDKMIAKVDGVMNGVSVVGDAVGETMYYGAGAGGDATASAVISDIIDIARDGKSSPMLGFKKPLEELRCSLLPIDEIKTKYYIRLHVKDEQGVLAYTTNLMNKYNISIQRFVQKPHTNENKAVLLFSTHTCKEADVKAMLEEAQKLPFVVSQVNMIRIED